MVKQAVLCLRCGNKNSIENKFCNGCGHPLYPPSQIKCSKCGAMMLATLNFCGECGLLLRRQKKRGR
ncbi:MAG: zinc-ribbon domain-containing protein [Candidatus Bathyarchaeia archaeon]